MSVLPAYTATMRQFPGTYIATIFSGLTSSVNSVPLLLTIIYDVFFFRDGSYAYQNIQGYFLCLSIVTILSHAFGTIVFGLPTIEESQYLPLQNDDGCDLREQDYSESGPDEQTHVLRNKMSEETRKGNQPTRPNYTPYEMIKSLSYTPLVLASGLLLSLKYVSINNLNVMLASFELSQYEASLPFLAPASAIILRPIFGILADWTRPYFSRAWYFYLSACMHLMSFIISIYKADNVYVLSIALMVWNFASDMASSVQPAVIADDFGKDVFSVNIGIHMTVFATFTFVVQSVVGGIYESHVLEGSTNCSGLFCFHETFVMGIVASIFSMMLVTLYFYLRHKPTKWLCRIYLFKFCHFCRL